MKELRKIINQSELLKKEETSHYLERIKVQRQEVEVAQRERERARKKILLAQQQTDQEIEKNLVQEVLLSKLLRQSKQERRIAEQYLYFA